VLAYLLILLVPGLILFPALTIRWPVLIGVVTLGLVATSGIFLPVTVLPAWLATTAKVFPVYWLGEGMRAATLPGGGQLVTAALILAGWALAGLVTAPILLRRMARRESGSRVADRRARLLQRVG
jgi:ABC-2 type transport system permease protein